MKSLSSLESKYAQVQPTPTNVNQPKDPSNTSPETLAKGILLCMEGADELQKLLSPILLASAALESVFQSRALPPDQKLQKQRESAQALLKAVNNFSALHQNECATIRKAIPFLNELVTK